MIIKYATITPKLLDEIGVPAGRAVRRDPWYLGQEATIETWTKFDKRRNLPKYTHRFLDQGRCYRFLAFGRGSLHGWPCDFTQAELVDMAIDMADIGINKAARGVALIAQPRLNRWAWGQVKEFVRNARAASPSKRRIMIHDILT